MRKIGLDIGTGKICAVLCEDGEQKKTLSVANDCKIDGEGFERLQNAEKIRDVCVQLVRDISAEPADALGITSQMHGILYVDFGGRALSPLYTWQDGRGDLPRGAETYAQAFSRLTGYSAYSGYGLVTHFYNSENGLVPSCASKLLTIGDYVAESLCGNIRMSATNAHSLGAFNLAENRFDAVAAERAGINPNLFPEIGEGQCGTSDGTGVFTAIGDNQASFLGSAGYETGSLLVNLGTGGQTSLCVDGEERADGLELRPFFGKYLLCRAVLCGGRSLALLKNFLESVLNFCGASTEANVYDKIAELFENGVYDTDMVAKTSFDGERADSSRAYFGNVTAENFCAKDFVAAELNGLVDSLCEGFCGRSGIKSLFGAGNGLRKNPYLVKLFEKRFRLPMELLPCKEEAALGAVRYTDIFQDSLA